MNENTIDAMSDFLNDHVGEYIDKNLGEIVWDNFDRIVKILKMKGYEVINNG